MRKTLAIADDVLLAARAIAEQQGRTVGDVVSDLARRALQKSQVEQTRHSIPLLPSRNPGAIVTLETVNALHDETP